MANVANMANIELFINSISSCIYRKKDTFELCSRCAKKNSLFCRYHNYSNAKDVYQIFYKIFGNKGLIDQYDIYNLYKHLFDTFVIIYYKEDVGGEIFKKILHYIPFNILLKASAKYIKNRTYSKEEIYDILYKLNNNTYNINNKECDIIKKYQEKIKYNIMMRNDNREAIINDDDLFTCEKISDIPKKHMFILKDKYGSYAFDVVELEYFVKNCYNEKVDPYNPYTREKFSENVLWKLKIFIKKNDVVLRVREYKWESNIRAFTDLSITIERNGFYNNPEWFNKMKTADILKTIKYFKDFSSNIRESDKFFCDINANTVVFDFCREAIKMFDECNNDLYVLCCNFVKALALCSNDFYENLPSWLLGTETFSLISNLMSTFDRNGLDYLMDSTNPNANMYSNMNTNMYTNMYSNMNSNMYTNINMNLDVDTDTNMNSNINATNNFLLYYYVEYM